MQKPSVSSTTRQALTLNALLERHAALSGKQAAIQTLTGEYNYQQLQKQTRGLAAGLRSLGIRKGDIVAVQLPNIPEFLISYLAITSLGGIMQTLHMPYREAELSYLLQDSGARAVIALGQFKDYSPVKNILSIVAECQHNLSVIAVGENIQGAESFSTLAENSKEVSEDVVADDPFILLYTSGTTSSPKGIQHNYQRFLNNARVCIQEYGFTHEDRILSLAPLSHLYGLFACNMTLVLGATITLLPTFAPADFIEVVKRLKPSAIFAGPAHFNACFNSALIEVEDFQSVKFVCLSGSYVASDLAKQVDQILINGKVGQLWGMSELQAGAITRLSDNEAIRTQTSGSATPGTQLQVADSDGKVLRPNKEGELWVKGESVFKQYFNKPQETRDAFSPDGWFKTGDLAVLDEQGNLKITGRTKHVINRGGVKYNPIEIETLINNLSQVQSCAVVAVEDETLGEKACAFVVLHDNKTLTLEAVTNMLDAAGIAKYKWPEELIIIDNMPLTPTNKVKTEELKEYFDSIKSSG